MRIGGLAAANNMKTWKALGLCALSASLLAASTQAIDVTWTNGNSGWDNIYAWDLNVVPGAGDRAIFNESASIAGYAVGLNISNDAVGDVLFSATTKGMYWKNATNTLTVLNSFIITQSVGSTAVNVPRTGTIAVTNSTGTAIFKLGDTASGNIGLLRMEHQISAGDSSITNWPMLIADNFQVSSNGYFTFNAGTLTTYGGSFDRGSNTELRVGEVAGDIATWNILRGTNTITYTAASGATRLGYATAAEGRVNVVGSNTLWSVGGARLNVANNGPASLTISNGAHVAAKAVYVNGNGTAGTNGVIYVDGPGSRLDGNGFFGIGYAASYAQMIVTNGARVVITNSYVTIGGGGRNVSNNLLKVTSTGTVFQVSDAIQLGSGVTSTDTVNQLLILDGAVVNSDSSSTANRVGASDTDADNSALVDGPGSLWAITGNYGMRVGDAGPRSSLTISRGGHVTIIGSTAWPAIIGNGVSASNNTVIVTGTNSLWDTGTFGFYVGNNGFGNTMIISNGAQVLAKVTSATPVAIGNVASSSNNVVAINGPGSRWTVDGYSGSITFRVGAASQNNRLTIADGAQMIVSNAIMTVGGGYLANGNEVAVTGNGSVLDVGDLLQIGAGTGAQTNSLQITQGGVVRSGGGTAASRIGRSFGDDNNNALVDGSGSLWQISGSNGFYIANGGNNNTLTIQNGGAVQVVGSYMLVGAIDGGTGNAATITSGSLAVTNLTGTGTLEVRSGTLTFNGGTITADYLRATTGTVTVVKFNSGILTVGGSAVSNGSPFVVGNGSAATFRILGGTNVFVDGLTITNNATLTGVGLIEGNVTFANSSVYTPGVAGVGTQTVANAMTLNSSTIVNFDIGSSAGDLVQVTGNLTLNGILQVSNAGGFGPGIYTLFTYGTLGANGLSVGSLPGGLSGSISNDSDNSRILLVVNSNDAYSTWLSRYSLSGGNAAGSADPDHDGMSNTNEYLAGFAPNNNAAYLHVIGVVRTNNDIKVTYLGANGDNSYSGGSASRTNVLEYTIGSANGSYWTNNFLSTGQTNILGGGTGTGMTTNMIDVGGATASPARYYRVRVLVP